MSVNTYDVFIKGREKSLALDAENVCVGMELIFKIGEEVVAEFAAGSWDGYRVSGPHKSPAERPAAAELRRS